MFSRNDLDLLHALEPEYAITVSNGHDIRLRSRITNHEWIIISPYDGSSCEIQHRHSAHYPFHHQRGKYDTLALALNYIKNHDSWYREKERRKASIRRYRH